MKIPYGMIMDQAKHEIMDVVKKIMSNNNIAPDMMSFIIDGVSGEVKGMKSDYYVNQYAKAMSESEQKEEK